MNQLVNATILDYFIKGELYIKYTKNGHVYYSISHALPVLIDKQEYMKAADTLLESVSDSSSTSSDRIEYY